MKISHMLKREDFYNIIQKTLESYYKSLGNQQILYVYPHLNAIACKKISKSVWKYLKTEYNIKGSLIKRIAVKVYCWCCMHSYGLLSEKRLVVRCTANKDSLIYPCNRKVRVFDFAKNTVSVIPKYGFPEDSLQKEIEFRKTYHADFIPKLLSTNGNSYTEEIMDGYPLARDTKNQEENTKRAYAVWRSYTRIYDRIVTTVEYCGKLNSQFSEILELLQKRKKILPYLDVKMYWNELMNEAALLPNTVGLTLSHGDLQPGNIWVENKSGRIIIIDWESYAERTITYDEAVLFYELRSNIGLVKYIRRINASKTIVLAEDLLFRLHEMMELPEQFGTNDFLHYLNAVRRRGG